MKKILIACFTMLFLTSCGWKKLDIINPNAELLYFYVATCSHCQELNQKIKEAGGIEQFSVEKREVNSSPENSKIFLETAKKLSIKEDDLSVPFVVNKTTWEYAIWTEPAFEIFMNTIKSSTEVILDVPSTDSITTQ